jgi:hypothetical protein
VHLSPLPCVPLALPTTSPSFDHPNPIWVALITMRLFRSSCYLLTVRSKCFPSRTAAVRDATCRARIKRTANL